MRPGTPGRARSRRRPSRGAAAVLLALLLIGLVAAIALPACGGNADPFAGLYWEPSTGRRVEIRAEEGGYLLFYGAAKRPFKATREGNELRIAEPMGGRSIVRLGDDASTLELETAGKTSLLKRLQQHQ
jgi:hypothetical protein